MTGARLRNCIATAISGSPRINWGLAPAQWTDDHEAALLTQLLADANQVNTTQTALAQWPNYAGRDRRNYIFNNDLGDLRAGRNSFNFDTTGI